MSKTKKIIVGVVVALVVIVTGLQIFLKHGLNKTIQRAIIPQAEKTLGVDVDIGSASVNLLGGSVRISGVRIGNPEGFIEPEIFSVNDFHVDLSLLALLKGTIKVSDVKVENLRVTLVRNKNGKINANKIQEALSGPEPEKRAAQTSEEKEDKMVGAKIPKLLISRLTIDILTEYVDHQLSKDPFRLGLKTSIHLRNVSTFEEPGAEWGFFAMHASLESNPDAFVTDIRGRIAPIIDPSRPSFDADGEISSIDMSGMDALASGLGIVSDSVSLQVSIRCRDAAFDKSTSIITTKFRNAKLVGKLADKAKGLSLPPEFSVPVALGGTIDAPEFDLKQALTSAIVQILANNINAVVDRIVDKEKIDKTVTDTFKKFGKKLKLKE